MDCLSAADWVDSMAEMTELSKVARRVEMLVAVLVESSVALSAGELADCLVDAKVVSTA
jgi:hypothetical protein